ncbi:MAG TPA: Fic family protein [Methylomirabilota bacterium]|nr:Fic family protein [Methylomirabilota bacterium]
MAKDKPAQKADIEAAIDHDEPTAMMEPLLVTEASRRKEGLPDLAFELAQKSAGLRRSMPASRLGSLATLVRTMNCYYSNLIEGHATHPVDIERALKNEYSRSREQRDLQLEAKAHIAVQRWIDEGGLKGRAVQLESIRDIHRRFCEHLPSDLLIVKSPDSKKAVKLIPGELRTHDVRVGQHVPISPAAVPRFLARFQEVYGSLGRIDTVIAAAAAHHRLVWIHPFLDGNGRVARLLSHAMMLETLDTGAVWSVARGLARNVEAYKGHLAACDRPRRNDLDGRGHLSEESLTAWTRFFLTTCTDQVDLMERLIQPDGLRARILLWAEEEMRRGHLPSKSGAILEAVLYRDELPRSDVPGIVGTGGRQARRVVSALLDHGVLVSETTRAPLRLAFPASLAPRWMPGLFPNPTR